MFKKFAYIITPFLLELFNRSLSVGSFPTSWKSVKVRPVPKGRCADAENPSSYRPIALLPTLSKLLERVVASQLWSHLHMFDLLPSYQSGYRQHYSTETAILKVLSDLFLSMDSGDVSLVASLDLQAAFDTVDHSILIQRLQSSFGLSGTILSWFSSFLGPRSMSVHCNKSNSVRTSSPACGVPQGSVLGPVLFVLYTSDIIPLVNRCGLKIHVFADDIVVYCSSSPSCASSLSLKLSTCLDDVNAWLCENRLVLNPSKSNVMWCFSRQRKFVPPTTVRVCNLLLSPAPFIKYLGFEIDSHLSLERNVSSTMSTCFSVLRRLRTVRRSISSSAMQVLVSSLVLSRLDYCISCYVGVPGVSLKRLSSVLHAAARFTTDSRRYDSISPILRELNWLPLRGRIERRIGLLVMSCLRGEGPSYLAETLQDCSTLSSRRRLRSASTRTLFRPTSRRPTLGGRSFVVQGPQMWNDLPVYLRVENSILSFKRLFNDYLSKKHL